MKYDAIVIGSGQAGNPLSYRLADEGWKVALVEKSHLGGTCINTGCTPTKTMVASAQVAHYARNAARWGVRASGVGVDLGAVVDRKDKIVDSFRSGQERRVGQRPNLALYRGQARFLAPSRLQVGDQVLEGERIFINTGTRTDTPRLEGLDAVPWLDNATLMELRELPEHLLVLGGGYIGLEFGQMFRRFGSRVTVVHRGEHVLAREDDDVADELRKILAGEGIRFVLEAQTTRVERRDGGIALTFTVGDRAETVIGSHLLVATGRRPNTDDLGLEKAGIEVDQRGYIRVDNRLRTNVANHWALGDVKGGPAFTHISYNDFQIVAANLLENRTWTTDNRPVPYCVFTDPQLGRVGMTEHEARATGRKLKIGKYPMASVARAIERDETGGFMKLVVDAGNDRILGATILGTEGGELVQTLGALMLADAPYTVLKGAVFIHPTLTEGFFGLMDAVASPTEPPLPVHAGDVRGTR
jgi:pyruvate/2-oxoglutarate dehydrogenase complex dihydrolipoamide dehydrogenase (E3) component